MCRHLWSMGTIQGEDGVFRELLLPWLFSLASRLREKVQVFRHRACTPCCGHRAHNLGREHTVHSSRKGGVCGGRREQFTQFQGTLALIIGSSHNSAERILNAKMAVHLVFSFTHEGCVCVGDFGMLADTAWKPQDKLQHFSQRVPPPPRRVLPKGGRKC